MAFGCHPRFFFMVSCKTLTIHFDFRPMQSFSFFVPHNVGADLCVSQIYVAFHFHIWADTQVCPYGLRPQILGQPQKTVANDDVSVILYLQKQHDPKIKMNR